MSNTNTGGPAFPHTVEYKGADCGGVVPHGGMSLRDYFAARAMQANRTRNSQYKTWNDLAKDAYEIADAMLKARAQ
jgi:hypothetical protein